MVGGLSKKEDGSKEGSTKDMKESGGQGEPCTRTRKLVLRNEGKPWARTLGMELMP